MPETKTYSGACHCGAVTFDVDADLSKVIECNCSRCKPMGLLLAFTPADRFRLKSPEEAMIDYRFNKHVIAHMVCGTCGAETFARAKGPDGTPTVAVNTRWLKGVDVDTLNRAPYDGASK